MNRQGITAIIPAAGYSIRMGQFKPLLKIGEETIIERSASLFRQAGVDDIRVVIGHCREQIEPVLEKTGTRAIVNHANTPEMFSSVLAALENLESHIQSIILLPADIPLVRPYTVKYLLEQHCKNSGKILIPCFHQQQGHPVVIPSEYFGIIRKWNGEKGLKGVLNLLIDQTVRVPVADANILLDLDTPSDYETILKKYARYAIPTRKECEAILRDVAGVDETIYAHCNTVADMAAKISNVLNRANCPIDHEQVEAAALLHDLAKGKPRHAQKAAELLTCMGFPEIADIVAKHTDIECSPFAPINGAEVLYLSDKLIKGNQVMDIHERFQTTLEKHGHDPEIKEKIEKRMHHAELIQKKIAAIIGKSLRGGRT